MLGEIRFSGFRNLGDAAWRPVAGAQVLLGPNGAGKTSVLEAVYLVATTRSFRTVHPEDLVRRGEPGFRLHGEVEGRARVGLEVGWDGQGRSRAVNGRATTIDEHLGVLPVVSWTAGEGRILDGQPADRRRFLDQGVVSLQPSSLSGLARYRRVLKAKRDLLVRGGKGLASWNEILATEAADIIRRRCAYVGELEAMVNEIVAEGGIALPPVALDYLPSPSVGTEGAAAILARLAELAAKERERRRPLVGPHRDDVRILFAGEEVARMASAGEKKLIGLVLLAARGRLLERAGKRPVYLLDDADSELDRGRLEEAWKLFARGAQVIASSSRPEAWAGLPSEAFWGVDAGRLSRTREPVHREAGGDFRRGPEGDF